jgi:hypothetical protein
VCNGQNVSKSGLVCTVLPYAFCWRLESQLKMYAYLYISYLFNGHEIMYKYTNKIKGVYRWVQFESHEDIKSLSLNIFIV